ncbi:hypothetical protein AUJ14_04605 [Candidatus Micrarchaeota archaeon CG1_02_55_22]|nr:MAG: hypothetical protein AUJ14_04605 [Candidatus Micrarchaeota archaeon CG1_02_55_22]
MSLNRRLSIPKRSVFKDLEVVRFGSQVAVRYNGQLYWGTKASPILSSLLTAPDVERRVGENVFGPTPPNAFVGEYGYPKVMVGPLVSVSDCMDADFFSSPASWYGRDYGEIVGFATSLVRGKKQHAVSEQSVFLSQLQDSVLSSRSVDVEVDFTKRPTFSYNFSPTSQPMGPSGDIRRFKLVGNPVISPKVDALVEEKLLVRKALPELLKRFDFYYIQKILSAGVLGVNKKLVPTKWSITASDDMIGKQLLQKVREYPHINDFRIYSNTFLDNHFEILLLPGAWEFEQFESWAPSTPWAVQSTGAIEHEYEPFAGRTKYAESEGGGYYAGRLGVIEALHRMRRQARAIVFREIGEGYTVPVGVWEVRENSRHAMQTPPTKCSTLREALAVLATRLKRPISAYIEKSTILRQRRLNEW